MYLNVNTQILSSTDLMKWFIVDKDRATSSVSVRNYPGYARDA